MLQRALLGVSRSGRLKTLVTRLPVTSGVASRFVAGETVDEAIIATRRLVGAGLRVSVVHLGENTLDRAQAEHVTTAYVELLGRLQEAGLSDATEVSLRLSAVGQQLGVDGEKISLENAHRVGVAAREAGTTVTLDMEDHTTTDSTLLVLAELRKDMPSTGVALQAHLRRTGADCHDLSGAGSRVRLCKGAYNEPESVAFVDDREVDKSYVRCLKVLMAGDGYPMVATHDPRLVPIAQDLAQRNNRTPDSWELQMLYGIRPTEQLRLANGGYTMRVYLPYGSDWYGYLVRRLAERPANLTFFVRNLISKT